MTEVEDANPPRRYMNLYSFVNHHVLPYFDRDVYKNHNNSVWCRQWWKHTEALARFNALWNAWEAGRLTKDPTAEINWLLQYAEPTMRILMSPQGCFRECADQHVQDAERRQPISELPPEKYFVNDVESEEFALVSASDSKYQTTH